MFDALFNSYYNSLFWHSVVTESQFYLLWSVNEKLLVLVPKGTL